MIRISQLKLGVNHTKEDLLVKVSKLLRIPVAGMTSYEIIKQSVDARKKDAIRFIYTIDIETKDEESIVHRVKDANVTLAVKKEYQFPQCGTESLANRPVIVGSGPAGLFCAIMLARSGYRPLILERGEDVDKRQQSVDGFWNGGVLNPNSNVQFGEGGA